MTARDLQRRFGILLVLRWLPVGLVSPVLILVFLGRDLTLAEIGPVLAGYSFVTLVAEIPTGGLADAYGRRRVLVSSALLQLAFFAMVLTLDGVVWMTLASMIGGASRALDSGPLEAWFVDELRLVDSDADIEGRLATGNMVDAITLSVGAVAGGFLGSLGGGNLDGVVLVALAAQVVHVVAASFLLDETELKRTAGTSTRVVFREARSVIGRTRDLRLLMGTGVGVGIALTSVEILFQPRFDDLVVGDAAPALLGLILAASFAAAAAGSAMVPRIRSRSTVPVGRLLFGVTGLQFACFVTMAGTDSPWITALGMLLLYGLLGVVHPVVSGVLHENTPSQARTTIVSARSATLQTGGLVGSLTLPVVAASSSIPVAWLLAGIVIGLVGLAYLGLRETPAENLVVAGTAQDRAPS